MDLDPDKAPRIRCERCKQMISGHTMIKNGSVIKIFPGVCPYCGGKPKIPEKYRIRARSARDNMKPNRDLGKREDK